MMNRWENLAREDAEFYIWTDVAKGDDFFNSGERDAKHILDFADPHISIARVALEIGCGTGRLTLPMARRFERVIAVDIAPTMLDKMQANSARRGIHNITSMLAGDAWHRVAAIDFAYSRIVLQHIEEWSVITDYFYRVGASLAPRGVFYVQFDTRAPSLLYHIKNALPDAVLRRNHRRGVRRIRRTSTQIRDLARQAGFELLLETGSGTTDTEYLFRLR